MNSGHMGQNFENYKMHCAGLTVAICIVLSVKLSLNVTEMQRVMKCLKFVNKHFFVKSTSIKRNETRPFMKYRLGFQVYFSSDARVRLLGCISNIIHFSPI